MENMETLTLTREQRRSIVVYMRKSKVLEFYVEDSKEKEDRNETVPLPAGKKTHGSVIDAAFAKQFCLHLQDPPSPYIVSSKKSPSVAKYKSSITFTIKCGSCNLRFLMKTTKEEYRAKGDLKLQFPRCRCTSLAPVDQGEAAVVGEIDEQQNEHGGGDLPVIAEQANNQAAVEGELDEQQNKPEEGADNGEQQNEQEEGADARGDLPVNNDIIDNETGKN